MNMIENPLLIYLRADFLSRNYFPNDIKFNTEERESSGTEEKGSLTWRQHF